MAGARIQLKRATASSWSSANPVLYAGEIGYETDTNKFKIGNGSTAYNSLPYFNGNLTGSSLNDLADVTIVSASNGDFLRWNGTAWINDAVNLSTDTVGNYMVDVAGGTGVTVTHTPGEGSTASVAIGQDVATTASVTFAAVTAPLAGNANTASALQNSRTISLSGDVSGSVSFDGSTNVTINTSVEPNSVALGVDTTGNYVNDIVQGTGVTVTHTPGEGSSASIAIGQDVATSASVTFAHVSADVTGDVLGDLTGNADTATTLETARTIELSGDVTGSVSFDGSGDVNIVATVVGDGVELGVNTTGNYMVDVVGGTGVTVSHTPGEGSTASVSIGQAVATSSSVTFAAVTAPLIGNADTASALQNARTIQLIGDLSGSASFDGSTSIQISASVEPNSVTLGQDTVGNYMQDVVGGTGVTVVHTPGESSTASVSIGQDVSTSASVTFANLTVSGDLTVNGTTTTLNTQDLLVEDNTIVLNANVTGNPSGTAGIEIERGSLTNVQLRWNETTDSWEITEDGTTYRNIAAGQDVETSSSVTFAHVTAPVSGNATTASALQTARAISLGGDLSGSASFDGSANITITADVQPNSVALGTDTTGNYVNDVVSGTGVTVTHTPGEGSSASIAIGQDVATTASVTFAAVTAPVIGNASTATTLQTARAISLAGDLSGSASFDGSANITITADVQPNSVALGTDTTGNYVNDITAGTGVTVSHTPGEGSSPTVSIGQAVGTSSSVTFAHVSADVTGALTGNASTATTLQTSRAISLAGDLSGSVSFNGGSDVTITAQVQPNSVALGTDTTGNYVADVVAGTGISVTHTPGEGSSASVALNAWLNDLGDVVIAGSPERFQTLGYDGAGWVNSYAPTVSYVRNAEATTLTVGTVVYLFGGTGDHASVKRASNTSDTTSSKTVGVVGTAIAANENGPVITRGYASGMNLASYSEGDVLWLGTNGQFTTTKPSAPDHLVFVGVVVRATNNGIIYVATQNGYELEELHDVKVSGLANGDFLKYVSASGVWVNDQINLGTDTVGNYVNDVVAGTGVTVTHTPGEGSSASIAIGQAVGTSASVEFHQLETQYDVIVGRNLYVSGSVVTENQVSLEIDDPFIYLNTTASAAGIDTGVVASYYDGSHKHAGYFRDSTDGKFKFFDSYTPEPTSPIDTDHVSYSPAALVAETFESTISTGSAPFVVSSTTEVANLHADTATTLHTSRAISLAGDLSGSASFDGSTDITITAEVQPNSVALGTDTTGNYVSDVTAGTGINVTHTPGEGSSPTISNAGVLSINGNAGAITGVVTTADTGTVTSAMILDGTIVNADINSSAAIAHNKLANATAGQVLLGTTTTGVVTATTVSGDITINGAGVTAIGSGVIVNADVNNSAAIAHSKLANITAGSILMGNASNVPTATAMSGDVTITSGGVTAIGAGVIVNADVSNSAAISLSKLASGTSAQVIVANASGVPTYATLSGDITISDTGVVSIAANSVALGTDTTGNYVSDVTAGTGVTVTHTPGEGSSPTIAIGQAVGTSSSVTFAAVTAPLVGNASTATTLQNARTISLGGDLSGSASFDGSTNVTITAAVQPDSVALGTDTTGSYVSSLVAGTGVTLTNNSGEGATPTVAIGQDVSTSSSVTFAAVTAPLVGNASTATTLQNARTINLGGDLSGSASFNGSADVTITATVQPNSVALGTDTTGNYVSDVTAGTGVTVTHTPGEGSSPTIAIGQAVGTSASVQFAQISTTGNVTIGGDLTVNGTTTTVNTETINLADNIIVLNSNETGAPSQNAGIEVERGSATNVALRWNEANDKWELTTDGTNYDNIATEDYAASLTPNSLDDIGDVTLTSASAGDFLKWNGSAWVNDPINLGSDTVGNYVSNVVAGNLITVTHTPGEGSSASIAVTNGTAGQIIVANASGVPTWVSESGDITIDSSGVTAISSGVIVNADISNSAAIAHSKLANASAGQVLLGTTTTGVVTATTVSGDVTITGAGVTAIGAGVIVDADINAAAAISHSKLANITAGSILMGNASNVPTATSVSGDVTITSGGVTAISSGVIVNADINSSAAIALSKLASGTSAQVIVANSSGVPTYTTLSGDVTISDTGVVSIAANSVALGTDTTGNYVANVSGGTGITVTHTPGEGSSASVALNATLDDLSNVTVPSPTNGQVLTYSTASSAWIAQNGASAINALDDIGDVTITSAASGDFLKWNGSAWVNDPINLGTDTTGNYMVNVSAGDGITVTHTQSEGSTATISARDTLVRFYMEVI